MKENAFLGVKFLGTPLEARAYGPHYLGYLPTLPHIPSTLRVNETPVVNHVCFQYLAKKYTNKYNRQWFIHSIE